MFFISYTVFIIFYLSAKPNILRFKVLQLIRYSCILMFGIANMKISSLTQRIIHELAAEVDREGLRVTARLFDIPPSTLADLLTRGSMSGASMDKIYRVRPEWFNGPGPGWTDFISRNQEVE